MAWMTERLWILAWLLFAAALPAGAQSVSVTCINNRDGSLSCQRLSDAKWFTCVASVGRTATCRASDGEPILCVLTGGSVAECRASPPGAGGGLARPRWSVFDP
jgi:hypothetical protein